MQRTTTIGRTLAGLAGLTLVLAACGDDDDSPSGTAAVTNDAVTSGWRGAPASDDTSDSTDASGDDASSTDASGDDASSDDTSGDDASSDDTSGDDASSDDSAGEGSSEITVTDEGAEDGRIELRGAYEVGQSAVTEMTMKTSISGGGRSLDITFTFGIEQSIAEVSDDGGYTVSSEITNVDTDTSEIDTSSLEALVGLKFQSVYDGDGNIQSTEIEDEESLSPEELDLARQVTESPSTQVAFPTTPVGEGATWDVDSTIDNNGITFDLTYHYTLTEIGDDTFTIENSYDEDLDTEIDGTPVTGTVEGGGEYTVSRDNPLDIDGTLTQTADFDAGGTSASMDLEIELVSE